MEYQDSLQPLNENIPLADKLRSVHKILRDRFDGIHRIAVALYESRTDTLRAFLASGDDQLMEHYEYKLGDSQSLKLIAETGRPRVIEDFSILDDSPQTHNRRLLDSGYQASYTLPMYVNGSLCGLLFFDSKNKALLTPDTLHYLDVFGHLISLLVINELSNLRTLLATIKTARDITHHRDFETGAHLDRMAHYSRLIATSLADRYGFDDEYIEQLFLFAPLHDIGKIAIPDEILLKRGKLTREEYDIMKTHAALGRNIIDTMLDNFGLDGVQNIELLRNIAHYHHEAMDGSGYPEGLSGEKIPIEARIIAVADVFDALTSQRPYKEAWSNDDAFAALKRLSGSCFDATCVQALADNRPEVEQIQRQFKEDYYA